MIVMRKQLIIATLFMILSGVVHAQDTCMSKSVQKKLAGSAKTNFLKKCESEAKLVCENDDVSKRTSGAAKASHIKKCVKDAVGS